MRKFSPSMAFILVVIIIDMMGIGLAFPLLPKLIQQLEGGTISDAAYTYALIGSIYALAQFFFSPIMGSLSDAYGRRPVLLTSQAGLAIDYLVMAFAPTLWWLALARLLSGMLAASIISANAYIADISTKDNRARNFGMMGAAFGIGFTLGPVVGGLLGAIDLRLPFLVAAGLAAVNFTFGLFVLPESLKLENRRPFKGFFANNPFSALLAILRIPKTLPLFLCLFAVFIAQRGLETTWILYVDYRFGWDIRSASLSLAFVGVVSIIMQGGVVGPVVKRFGEVRTLIGGYCCSAVALLLMSAASQGWMIYPLITLHMIGNSCSEPSMRSMLARQSPPSEQGLLQGRIGSMSSIVTVIAPFAASMLLSNVTGPHAIIPYPGLWYLIGSLCYLLALAIVLRKRTMLLASN